MACATLKRNYDWESVAQQPAKRQRCATFATGSSSSPGLKVSENKPSIFGEAVSAPAKFTPERTVKEIYNELKRLQRRRQLRVAGGAVSSSSGSEGDASPPRGNNDHARTHSSSRMHSRPVFTFKQVSMICERLLGEQEVALRAEYERALHARLAEQYEAFVRFNLDQVQRRPPPATCMPIGMDAEHHMPQDLVPSYLS